MHAVWGYLCHEPCKPFGLSAWIVVFAGLQLFLSQVRSPVLSMAGRPLSLNAAYVAGIACNAPH